jgi:pilus assembly protein CpaB
MNRNVAAAANPGNRRLILAAVALGLLGAILVYMASSSRGGGSPSSAPAGAGVPVVIAKTDIPARTKITAPMVEVRLVPEDAASALGFKDASQVVGQVTRFPVAVNEQVLTNKIVSLAGTAASGRSLSYVIPPGKRAVTIPTSERDAGGLLLPGDYVDIMVIWDVEFPGRAGGDRQMASKFVAQTMMQNVQILAVATNIVDLVPEATPPANGQVARNSEGKPTPGAGTVTLALSPQDAEKIYLAEKNSEGNIRLSLRAYGDGEAKPIDYVTKLDLVPPNLPNPFLR